MIKFRIFFVVGHWSSLVNSEYCFLFLSRSQIWECIKIWNVRANLNDRKWQGMFAITKRLKISFDEVRAAPGLNLTTLFSSQHFSLFQLQILCKWPKPNFDIFWFSHIHIYNSKLLNENMQFTNQIIHNFINNFMRINNLSSLKYKQ